MISPGDTLSMADVHIWPFLERVLLLKPQHNIEVLPSNDLPNISQYVDRMNKEPCVAATATNVGEYLRVVAVYRLGKFPEDL